VRDLLGLGTEIVDVVSEGASVDAHSIAARRIVSTSCATTFADGVACRDPDPDAFALIMRGAARVFTVSDTEIAQAMRLLLRTTTHNFPEPADAVALAGLLRERHRQCGRRVARVLTGGQRRCGNPGRSASRPHTGANR